MDRCVIVCAGEPGAVGFSLQAGDFVIACDGGYERALQLGIPVDLLMGDFDSWRQPLPQGVAVLRFPAEKDDTDSMLAVKEGFNRGFRRFSLLCALGGWLGHTLANIQTLAWLLRQGCEAEALGPRERVFLLQDGEMLLEGEPGRAISVFAYGGAAQHVSLKGLKYPLEGALTTSFPLGVSNRFLGGPARIGVRDGTLLVVVGG